MNIVPKCPADLQWFETELPDVHDVPKHCLILAWFVNDFGSEDSKEWKDVLRSFKDDAEKPDFNDWNGNIRRIEVIHPREDDLNPLKWCDSSCMPIGYCERVKYWAWVSHPTLIGKVIS